MPQTKGTHLNAPLLGSHRDGSLWGRFLENVPVEKLNPAMYMSWSMDRLVDGIAVAASNSLTGMTFGQGSGTTNGTLNTSNDHVSLSTTSTDNDEILMVVGLGGRAAFRMNQPNRPITWFFEGNITAVAGAHVFLGMADIDTVTAAGPLVAGTGALADTRDLFGFHWQQATNPTPTVYSKRAAVATVSAPMTSCQLVDNVDFRCAIIVNQNTMRWLFQTQTSGGITAATSQGILSHTAATTFMGPTICIQNHGGVAAKGVNVFRNWAAQRRVDNAFTNWH